MHINFNSRVEEVALVCSELMVVVVLKLGFIHAAYKVSSFFNDKCFLHIYMGMTSRL